MEIEPDHQAALRWSFNLFLTIFCTRLVRRISKRIILLILQKQICSPNLHTLRLPRHTNDLHMHHIPKTLFHLSLRLSCVTDAGNNIINIPKNWSCNVYNSIWFTGITIACQRAPALQSLSVSFTRCSDASLPRIPPSVTSLNLSFTEVTDAGLTRLPRTLKTLDLKSTKITGTTSHILFMPALTSL